MINPSPKVLILATSYAPEIRSLADVNNEHPRTDYIELSKLVCSKVLDYYQYDQSPILSRLRPFEKKIRMDLLLAVKGIRQSHHYDIVLLMSERVAIPYALLRRIMNSKTPAVLISAHSSMKQAKFIRSLRLSSQFSSVVSNTPAQKAFLVNEMGISEDSISFVPYTVDDEFFRRTNKPKENYILSVGGVPGRDYKTLIDAVRGTEFNLKIISGGRLYGRKTSGGIDHIPNNVHLDTGLNSKQMREVYNNAAMVVIPLTKKRSDAAGSSAILEAMSTQCPLIVSASCGIRHYLKDNVNSILVEPESPKSLREAITSLMNDSKMREALGNQARKLVDEQLAMKYYVERLRRVIDGEKIKWPLA